MAEAARLKKTNRGNYKVNSMLRSLKALFGYARKVHEIEHQPCRDIDFYPITISLKRIPSDKDIEAVKAKCNPEQKALIDFVDQTGCRIMEAIRFTYEDVDGDLIALWTRKSKNSNLTPRRIPKPDCLSGRGKGRVFNEWDAYPRFLEDKIKELDQPKWNWHNLRHRRASLWAKSGMPIFELMVRLGHSNLQTTQRYLQLLGFTRF
jgi:integrase